jgi:DNA-binding NtrC family response regulator
MPNAQILVSWIGLADMACMAADIGEEERGELTQALNLRPAANQSSQGTRGPVRTLVEEQPFAEVHLLTTFSTPAWANDRYAEWIGCKPVVHEIPELTPTDYKAILETSRQLLTDIVGDIGAPEGGLALHLSPGSPAMTAVWVLLGKSLFPATFYQTYRDKAWETEVPLDLYVDFLPRALRETDHALRALSESSAAFADLAGDSDAMRDVVVRAQKVAPRHVPVLLLGKSGTGKEVIARRIHKASGRGDKAFHTVHCAAIPSDVLPSELFGHKKGAYTGATGDRMGAFAAADGGTLFLDEIGECDPDTQVKLLRALQPEPGASPSHCTYRPVGADKDHTADVRVIAATNRDLLAAVDDGEFREDLYYRLAVVTISLPALQDRRDDIVPLAEVLLREVNEAFAGDGYEDRSLSPGAMSFLASCPWPGNVRQMQNALTQAAVMSDEPVIQRSDLAAALYEGPRRRMPNPLDHGLGESFCLADLLDDIRRHYIERAKEETRGVLAKAAKLLGYDNYQTLRKQIDRLGIDWPQKPRKN